MHLSVSAKTALRTTSEPFIKVTSTNMKKTNKISRRHAIQSLGAIAAGTLINPVSIFATEPAQNKVRFAVLGDWGTGDDDARGIASQMCSTHRRTPFDFVIAAGDNIYPDGDGRRFNTHFERPFAPLLGERVNFYAVLGNHDVQRGRQDQCQYPLFNMGGKCYYTLKKGDGLAEFFMIDSTDFDATQAAWLQQALSASTSRWKIAVFHHPLYSSGDKHGSNPSLRSKLEPLLTSHGVNAVFSGHDHIYERTKPQQRIQYFVTGAGGKTRRGGVELDSPIREVSFDEDNHFMLLEVDHRHISFQAISEAGRVVDRGVINPA
jgi:3',5'-cyclic AMP phosphodiesterase CpdA